MKKVFKVKAAVIALLSHAFFISKTPFGTPLWITP